MRLTVEEDRETIKRFGHIKPARGRSTRVCSARCPGTTHTCTLELSHGGPHVAHRFLNRVVAVWDSVTEDRVPGETLKRASEARAQSGLRTRESVGVLGALWKRVVKNPASVEEVTFLVLFLAFVGFAIDWFLRILG